MSKQLDQIKHNIHTQLSQIFKQFKTTMNPDDWKEFESWFWKIRPNLSVDLTQYSTSCRVYDEEPESPKIESDK